MGKYYNIGEFAKLINKSPDTLRRWDKEGKLKPSYITSGKHRMYSENQLRELFGYGIFLKNKTRKVIGYCRVSSLKQKDDLERQIKYVTEYMIARGYSFEIMTDIGSGINYNKKGLNSLIELVINNEVEKIVILYKDRLVRFGYELIENICKNYNTEIEIIDNTIKSEDFELVDDLIQIITVFSCRLQEKRANKARRLIKELRDENNKDKDKR
ncbi:MAG TPA: IS607 family transposase [Candidatus Eremiobacteraeota bacterium]|nr:IS607 family transposase [Candidatus Eremiobacteraeota bacterium]